MCMHMPSIPYLCISEQKMQNNKIFISKKINKTNRQITYIIHNTLVQGCDKLVLVRVGFFTILTKLISPDP
jgi:hypothetical protein